MLRESVRRVGANRLGRAGALRLGVVARAGAQAGMNQEPLARGAAAAPDAGATEEAGGLYRTLA